MRSSSISICCLLLVLCIATVSGSSSVASSLSPARAPPSCYKYCQALRLRCTSNCHHNDQCIQTCQRVVDQCDQDCAGQPPMAKTNDADHIIAHHHLHQQWTEFKLRHSKKYSSSTEELHRLTIFTSNMELAHSLTIKSQGMTKFGATPFADLTQDEFKKTHLSVQPASDMMEKVKPMDIKRMNKKARHHAKLSNALPVNFDWRAPDRNRPAAITPIKDQGQCGSCWAFSSTEEVESMWILSGHSEAILAPQQLVDCDMVDLGCNGGQTETAFAYIEQNGLELESSYPYYSGTTHANGTCQYNSKDVVAHIKSFEWATPGCNDTCSNQNEETLAYSTYNIGPSAIYVDASHWQFYESGIYTAAAGCMSTFVSLDHGVQLVGFGYDTILKHKYWTVRNSWNTSVSSL